MVFYLMVSLYLNYSIILLLLGFFFTNLDFLIAQTEHFDGTINVLFFVFKIFEFRFSVFFLHLTQ